MQRDDIIQILQAHRRQLNEQFGVRSLDLFGSLVRDEATAGSDIDLLVEFDRPVGYFGLVALQEHLAQLLNQPVDVGTLRSLKPRIRHQVEKELMGVF
jgi:predicted nucleotidyltransferase